MTAITLNRILIGVIAFMIAATIAGFYFATQFLAATALQTDHLRTDNAMSEENRLRLQQLRNELNKKSTSVERARLLVGSLEGYDYQNRVVEDLTTYAKLAGSDVRVTNFTFTDPAKKVQSAAQKKQAVTIPGVTVLDATVTLNSPVSYRNFMRFLAAIEQNLTKMQVTGINITPDNGDPALISGPTVNLQIYVREK